MPFNDPGVKVHDNWDTLGMRTASNDVTIDDVFVPDERVARRPPVRGRRPPLQIVASIAFLIVGAVYLGVAESKATAAIAGVSGTPRANDPSVQRQVGLMRNRLQVAVWALEGAFGAVGDDPAPSMDTVAAVMAAKREVANAGIEVCDLAMEIAGGGSFFRGSTIERAYRDIRGIKFHPFNNETTLLHAGRLALGLPCDEVRRGDGGIAAAAGRTAPARVTCTDDAAPAPALIRVLGGFAAVVPLLSVHGTAPGTAGVPLPSYDTSRIVEVDSNGQSFGAHRFTVTTYRNEAYRCGREGAFRSSSSSRRVRHRCRARCGCSCTVGHRLLRRRGALRHHRRHRGRQRRRADRAPARSPVQLRRRRCRGGHVRRRSPRRW